MRSRNIPVPTNSTHMTPRPFHRWKSFWIGIFVIASLCWSWWRRVVGFVEGGGGLACTKQVGNRLLWQFANHGNRFAVTGDLEDHVAFFHFPPFFGAVGLELADANLPHSHALTLV